MKPHPAVRLASLLLWLYPPSFRRACGADVLQFVRTAAANPNERQVTRLVVADAARSLVREWSAVLVPLHARHARFNVRQPGEHLRNLVRDLGLGLRLLRKSPTFTIAAVLTLALGIGANTAIFTLAEATLLNPVHVREPGRLVVWSWTSAYPDYEEYAKRTDVFAGVAAVGSGGRLNLVVDGTAELARAAFVTGRTLDVLGVQAVHGRTILPGDDVANGPLVAVLSHDYWRRRFGSDPSVVGQTFRANGRPLTIVGVLEKNFRGISLSANTALYLPTGAYNQVQTGFFSRVNALTAKGFVWLTVIGRLQPGVSAQQAGAAMSDHYARLHPREPGEAPERLDLQPISARALGGSAKDVRSFVAILVSVVALTLLIGCANLANLLLARSSARRREIGVRLAIGATRGRILRQMLAESVLLATMGGLAGIAVAWLALRLLASYQLPGGIAIENLRLEVNGLVLAVTCGLSLVTGLLFGALPSWRASRTDVLTSLRGQTRGATSSHGVRSTLLAVQVALSLVLLIGTGLFARSLKAALDTPLGFDVRGVVTASVNVGLARYDEGRAQALYDAALEKVRVLPHVTAAAWASMIPTRGSWVNQTRIDGYGVAPGEDVTVQMAQVGRGYFRSVNAQLLQGREFQDTDTAGSPRVAVVNKAMADTYWQGRSPIGGRLEQGDGWVTVVGVVENAVTSSLEGPRQPFAYLAFEQWLSGKHSIALDPAHLVVRTSGDAADSVTMIRDQLRSLDPEIPLYDVTPLEQHVSVLLMPQRLGLALFTLVSTLALALSTVGIYGVATYVAAQRTREIGLRIALGASAREVLRMVLLQGSRPIVLGIGAGLLLALLLSRLVESFLVGVSPSDAPTLTVAIVVLSGLALAASYLPARRASRMEPLEALRDE